jgi:hypothetical protein
MISRNSPGVLETSKLLLPVRGQHGKAFPRLFSKLQGQPACSAHCSVERFRHPHRNEGKAGSATLTQKFGPPASSSSISRIK